MSGGIGSSLPIRVQQYAVEKGYGYKSANLLCLAELCDKLELDLEDVHCQVPRFLPISHSEIQIHLLNHFPELDRLWREFQATLSPGSLFQGLSDAQKELLELLRGGIQKAFTTGKFHHEGLNDWMEARSSDWLIVRSTGREDSEELANAGGNHSEPYVLPTEEALHAAIGKVLASYFGERSILQRWAAGDKKLFTEGPFLPVLVQEMVVEDELIPSSGVLLTHEPDKAHDVSVINASYGHNEGVVSSRVAVDSYYIDRHHHIQKVLREKPQRMAEGSLGKGLAMTSNAIAMRKGQVISDTVLRKIKQVVDYVALAYGGGEASKAMDMEFTCKGDGPCDLFLLQARPLVQCRSHETPAPSYLAKSSLGSNFLRAMCLLDGNAWVRSITGADEVLFSEDIPAALDSYLKTNSSGKISCIISRKTAPASSHEALTLRAAGLPVLVVNDRQEFDRLRTRVESLDGGSAIWVDPQQGIIAWGEGLKTQVGLTAYPIPLELSIPMSSILDLPEAGWPAAWEKIQARYQIILQTLNPNDLPLIKESPRELLGRMGQDSQEEAGLAAASLMDLLWRFWGRTVRSTDGFRQDLNRDLFRVLEHCLYLMETVVKEGITEGNAGSPERLFPLRFLEACLYQQDQETLVDAFSFGRIASKHQLEQRLTDLAREGGVDLEQEGGQEALTSIYAMAPALVALNENLRDQWIQFVGELSGGPQQRKELLAWLLDLERLGLGVEWLHLCFAPQWRMMAGRKDRSERVLESLLSEREAVRPIFKKYQRYQSLIEFWQRREGKFGQPDFTSEALPQLAQDFLAGMGFSRKKKSSEVKADYSQTPKLGRLLILNTLGKAVAAYDGIAKSIKSSRQYVSSQQQLAHFAQSLRPYREMMETTLDLLSDQEWSELMTPDMGESVSRSAFLRSLREGTSYHFGWDEFHHSRGFDDLYGEALDGTLTPESQWVARPEFNVAAFAVGSRLDYNFSVHWPTRLEEYFTSFHQNCEQVRKYLTSKCGMRENLLSEEVQRFARELSHSLYQSPSHLSHDGNEVHLVYQVPLRQHSARLTLNLDPRNPQDGWILELAAFGNDEHSRWDQLAAWGALLSNGPWGLSGELAPQIDYSGPEGTQWAIRIPGDFLRGRVLAKTLADGLVWVTMTSRSASQVLSRFCQGMGSFKWRQIDPSFFEESFALSGQAIQEAAEADDIGLLISMAKHSLIGLARTRNSDYSRLNGVWTGIHEAALSDWTYEYLPGRARGGQTSLKQLCLLILVRLDEAGSVSAREALQGLRESALIQAKLPGVSAALEWREALRAPDEEKWDLVERFYEAGANLECGVLLATLPQGDRRNEWKGKLQEVGPGSFLDQLEKVYSKDPALARYYIQAFRHWSDLEEVAEKLVEAFHYFHVSGPAESSWQSHRYRMALRLYQECPESFRPRLTSIHQWLTSATRHSVIRLVQKVHYLEDLWAAEEVLEELKDILGGANCVQAGIDYLREVKAWRNSRYTLVSQLTKNRLRLHGSTAGGARIRLAHDCLLGAAVQHGDSFDYRVDTPQPYPGLQDFLGHPEYSFVKDNVYETTWNTSKAAVFYLIQGMESQEEELREEAKQTVANLIRDYLFLGKEDSHHNALRGALESLSIAYYRAEVDRGVAAVEVAKTVKALWFPCGDFCPDLLV